MKQFNCLPFEQKNKNAKNQATSCRNFKNICKSMAQRQCFKMVLEIIDNPFRDKITYKSGPTKAKQNTLSALHLDDMIQFVFCPRAIIANGIEFRKNLVVGLKHHQNLLYPSYGIIREIVDVDGILFLLLRTCDTVYYDNFVEAYEVQISEQDVFIKIDDIFQHTTFSFWKRFDSDKKYISRRVFNQDY